MELQHLLGNLERAVEDKFAAARGGSEEILRIARPTFEALKLLILDFEGKVGQVTQSIAGHLVRAASGLELRPSDHQAIVKACELIAEHKSKAQFRLGEPGGPYLLVTGLDSCLAEIASYFERRMQEVEIPHAERTALVKWARSTISGFAIQYSTLVLGITLRVYELDRESLAKARALLERAGVVLPRIRTVTEMPGPSRPLIRDVGAQARTEEWVKAIAIKMQEHCLGLPQETLDRALAVIGQAIEDLVDCALVSLYQLRSPLQLLAEFEALKTSRGAGERQSAEDTLVRAYVAFIDDYEHSLARWESDSERLLDFARGGLNSLFKTQTFDLREAMCLALAEAKRLAKGCYWRYLHSLLDRIERPRAEVGKSDIVSVTLSERMHCVEFPRGVRVPQPDRARLAEKMSSFAYSSSFPAAFAGDPRYEYEASAFRELTSEIEHLGTRALRFFETLDYVAAFGRGELSGVRTPLAEIEKAFHLRRAWLKQVFAHLDEVVRNGTAGKSRAFLDEIRKTLLGYRTALIHPESEVIFDAPNAAPLKRYAVELFRSLSLGLPEDALSTHFLPTAASRAGSVFGDIARIMKNLEVGFRPPDGY